VRQPWLVRNYAKQIRLPAGDDAEPRRGRRNDFEESSEDELSGDERVFDSDFSGDDEDLPGEPEEMLQQFIGPYGEDLSKWEFPEDFPKDDFSEATDHLNPELNYDLEPIDRSLFREYLIRTFYRYLISYSAHAISWGTEILW